MKRNFLMASLMAAIFAIATPASAGGIVITDAYARASSPTAGAGAVYMTIMNNGDSDERLIGVSSDGAKHASLHTHIDQGDGVILMRPAPDGFEIPAGGMHRLARGGDHVMLMGLAHGMQNGDEISLTLTFENAGEIAVTVPVDMDRMPGEGGEMDRDHMDGMDNMDHSDD